MQIRPAAALLPALALALFPALAALSSGCSGDAAARRCPPGTHGEGAICAPNFGTFCPAETHFVDGGGCVADADAGAKDGGGDDDGDFPVWFVGRWATDCDSGTNAYRIERAGPSRVRQVHESGNSYEFEITVKGDVIEMIGDYNGGKQIIRERVISQKKTQYFYHFFDGSEWPAKGTYLKCE